MSTPSPKEVSQVAHKGETKMARGPLAFIPVAVLFFLAIALGPRIFETNNAGFFTVKQAAVTGNMSVRVEPGMFIQGFGSIWKYKQAETLTFSSKQRDAKGRMTDPIEVRYQDGAKGAIMGNIRFRLPSTPDKLILLHKDFRGNAAVVNDMILPALRQAVLLTASLKTAEESYTTGRADLDAKIEDQLANGIFKTRELLKTVKNPITGQEEEKTVAELIIDEETGKPVREPSVLKRYGIQIMQVVINDLEYEESVNSQIAAKRKAIQEAATAKANAERAKQDRLTAEQEGLKNVKVAQYQEEEKKIRATVLAEQLLLVAKLDRKTAEQQKAAAILRGQGEAQARRLVMQADGALTQRLETLRYVADRAADAVKNAKHPFVPQTVFGGSGVQTNGAKNFIDLMTMQAAQRMGLSLGTKNVKAGQ